MKCVDCGVEFTTQDALADAIVEDDEGKHHRECASEGPAFTVGEWGSTFRLTAEEGWTVNSQPYNPDEDGVHQPMTPEEEEAENDRRREHGDPPLPPPHVGYNSNHGRGPWDRPLEDHYDPADDRGLEEARHEEQFGGLDDEGRAV